MVALDEVHLTNPTLKTQGPGLVGVFVGGNSGIGASTLKAFVTHAESPKVYILARTSSTATTVLEEAKTLNPSTEGTFIATDASLLSNVNQACQQILATESHINILVFTCGGFSATGRQLTPESLDRKLVLNYYARILTTKILLPLLRASPTAAVLSILGGGRESPILVSDLPLNEPGNYSLKRQFAHSIVSTDLMFERWAAAPENANVRFVHQFPGYVATNQVDGFLGTEHGVLWMPVRWLLRVLEFCARPLAVPLRESGERTLFLAVSERFPAGGAYILGWDGEVGGVQSVLQPLRDGDVGKVVEGHFQVEVERVLGGGGTRS